MGYDHKAMGITARGAWVSVQRHFRERGIDCQTEEFTCVGIGDMSGDVFGNGLLCSETTRLVAAFDHRDVFVDPRPGRGGVVRRAPPALRPAALELAGLRQGADLRGRRRLPARAEVGPGLAADARGARAVRRPRRHRHPRAADEGDPPGAGRPPLERRHRHLRQGARRDARRGRRQGQRRHPGRRARRAGPVHRRGRQPRPDPGGPDRVRAARRRRRRTAQHRLHRQLGRRRHLRPRGQHQDPAGPGGQGRRPHREAAQQPARRDDRRGRRDLVLRDNYEQNLALANALAHAPSLLHVHEEFMRQAREGRRPQPRGGGAARRHARYDACWTGARGSALRSCPC